MKASRQGGYIGLLALLLAVAAMALVIFWNYDAGPQRSEDVGPRETTSTSYIETRLDALDRAKAAKEALESRTYSIE